MPRRIAAPALALLTIALVACGGQAAVPNTPTSAQPTIGAGTGGATPTTDLGGVLDDKAPGTKLDACGIVTSTDVAAATKTTSVTTGTLKATPTSLSPGHSDCTYEGDFGRILVALTPEDGANLYDAARGSYKDASDITGTWDGAFNSEKNNRAFVWKGNVTVMFTLFLNGDLEQLPVATELARQVVGRL